MRRRRFRRVWWRPGSGHGAPISMRYGCGASCSPSPPRRPRSAPGSISAFPFGLAEAITWPAASILLSRWFPRLEYSQAMSLQNLGLVVGAAIAPPLVAFIITFWGWQMAFIVTGLIAGLLGTFFYFYTLTIRPMTRAFRKRNWLDPSRSVARGANTRARGLFWACCAGLRYGRWGWPISDSTSSTSCSSPGTPPI